MVLSGTHTDEPNEYLRQYNGILKRTDLFIKSQPEFSTKNVRICIAVSDFGQYYNPKMACMAMHYSYSWPDYLDDLINETPAECREDTFGIPQYIQDIFDAIIMPRLCHSNNQRLDLNDALKNMRRLNIVAHCHGASTVIILEKLMQTHMTKLGYSPTEQKHILSQCVTLAYNPDAPTALSKTNLINIESASDSCSRYKTQFMEWLLMSPPKFNLIQIQSNYFVYKTIYKKARDFNTIDIKDWMNITSEKSHKNTLTEHGFLGFVPSDDMSIGAKRAQMFANNILTNSVKNSLSQTKTDLMPLPDVSELAIKSVWQTILFHRCILSTIKVYKKYKHADKNKIDMHANWRRSLKEVSL